jgi:hypothetical protein
VINNLPWGIHNRFVAFNLALHITGGEVQMPWWRKGSPEEDEILAQAAQVLLDGIGDADFVAKVKEKTGVDIREGMTQEKIEKLVSDKKWYDWSIRKN